MKILALIENTTASDKLNCEHGLSLYVEHQDEHFLIDAGATGKFIENAKRMKIPLDEIEKVALSHNHSDHCGGIDALLKKYPDIKIFAKQKCEVDLIYKIGVFKMPIGQVKELKKKYPKNFVMYNNFQEISDGFYMMSDEVRDEQFTCKDKNLLMIKDGNPIPDNFEHESFAVIFPHIEKKKGCVIVSPCSHSGIVNIIKTVKNTWSEVPITAIVGGFHLMKASSKKLNVTPEYVEEMAQEIKRLDVGTIYTCHCTGQKGYEELKKHLGDQIQYLQTGEELLF